MMVYVCAAIWLYWWAAWLVSGLATLRNDRREPFRARLPHLIPLQLGVALVFAPLVVSPHFTLDWPLPYRWGAFGGIVAGLAFASWARLHLAENWTGLVAIKQGHRIVQTGPYRWIRHPIYTGLLFAMVSTALCVNTWAALVGACCWFVAYVIKSRHEEEFLLAYFGKPYQYHCGEVQTRIIPGIY